MHQATMHLNCDMLLKKIRQLPDEKVYEIINHIDELLADQGEKNDPLADVIGSISGKALSSREIDEQLYGKSV